MGMKDDKKKKKFKIRNPFKKLDKKKRPEKPAESSPAEVSPARTHPEDPIWDDDPYEPPSPRRLFGSVEEAQEEESSSLEKNPVAEEFNEGWASFEAKPVEELPMPFARSRRQLVKGSVQKANEPIKKDTPAPPIEATVPVSVEMNNNAVEVSKSSEASNPAEQKHEEREKATELQESLTPVGDKVEASLDNNEFSIEPEKIESSDDVTVESEMPASSDKQSIGVIAGSDEEEIPKPVVQKTQETLKRLDPPKSDMRSPSRRQCSSPASDPPAAHASDFDIWTQFGLPTMSVSSDKGLQSHGEGLDSGAGDACVEIIKDTENEFELESPKLNGQDAQRIEVNEVQTAMEGNAANAAQVVEANTATGYQKECVSESKTEDHQSTAKGDVSLQGARTSPSATPSIPLTATSSMATQKAGTRKVFAESMKTYVAQLNDTNIQEALVDIDEKMQERDDAFFTDSFTDKLDTDSEGMSETTPVKKALTMRFVPTMSATGETELVAVYEDDEDTGDEVSTTEAENKDKNVEKDESILPNIFLTGLWQEANPPNIGDDHTVSSLTRDNPSVFSSNAGNLDLHKPDTSGITMSPRRDMAEEKMRNVNEDETVRSAADSCTADSRDYTDVSRGCDTTYDSRAYTTDSRSYRRYGDQSTISKSEHAADFDDDYTYSSRMTGTTFETNDDTYATRDTGASGYASTSDGASKGRTIRRHRGTRAKSGRKTVAPATENMTSSSFRPRTLTAGSASFTEDEYDDDETIGTDYTNNDGQPSALDELADMAEELRQSGPGVIMNWLS